MTPSWRTNISLVALKAPDAVNILLVADEGEEVVDALKDWNWAEPVPLFLALSRRSWPKNTPTWGAKGGCAARNPPLRTANTDS